MLPSIVRLGFGSSGKTRIRLWLPVFLLWPFLAVLFLLVLPVLGFAEVILRACAVDIRLFRIVFALFSCIAALRGLRVRVAGNRQDTTVDIAIT